MAEQSFTGTITGCSALKMEGPWDIEVTIGSGHNALVLAFRDQKLPMGSKPLFTGHTMKGTISFDGENATAKCWRDDKASFPPVQVATAAR